MCTAISENGKHHLFGRTLDFEVSYGESLCITPRKFPFDFRHEPKIESHSAIIGIAHVREGVPLYYDAMNEHGVAIAGLNFPGNAVYNEPREGCVNIASFEIIPFVLSKCQSVCEARELLCKANITNDSFAENMPSTPLHFMVSDKNESITVEPLEGGVRIYDNPFGVLTNNPPFDFHTTFLANFMALSSTQTKNTLCPDVSLSHYSRGMGAYGLPGDFSSASRFVRAVFAKNHTSESDDEIGRFFHIMDTVCVPCGCVKTDEGRDVFTIYTSCGCTDKGRYYYTTYDERTVRSMSFFDADLLSDKLTIKKL